MRDSRGAPFGGLHPSCCSFFFLLLLKLLFLFLLIFPKNRGEKKEANQRDKKKEKINDNCFSLSFSVYSFFASLLYTEREKEREYLSRGFISSLLWVELLSTLLPFHPVSSRKTGWKCAHAHVSSSNCVKCIGRERERERTQPCRYQQFSWWNFKVLTCSYQRASYDEIRQIKSKNQIMSLIIFLIVNYRKIINIFSRLKLHIEKHQISKNPKIN